MWELSVMQTTHTPQSKKGAKQLSRYVKNLQQSLRSQVPWLDEEETQRKREISQPDRMKKAPHSKVVLKDIKDIPQDAIDFFNSLEGKVDIEREE